jgi:O-antigen ligase
MGALTTLFVLIAPISSVNSLASQYLGWNKNYLASVYIIGCPLILGVAIRYRRAAKTITARAVLAAALACVVATFLSGSYSAVAGLATAMLLIYLAFRLPRFFRIAVAALPAVFVAVSVFTAVSPSALDVANYFDGLTGHNHTMAARVLSAQIAMRTFEDAPILGVGEDRYQEFAFEQLGTGSHGQYYGNGLYQPHNFLVYIAVETGVLGVAAFMLILVLLSRIAIRGLALGISTDRGLATVVICCALFGYLTRSLFDLFDVSGTGTMFWLLLGLAYNVTYSRGAEPAPAAPPHQQLANAAPILSTVPMPALRRSATRREAQKL